jgi:hypothetical protein
VYPTARRLGDLALERQRALLGEAAEARLIHQARRSPHVLPHESRTLRSRFAAGLRTLSAWMGDRTQAVAQQRLQGNGGLEVA